MGYKLGEMVVARKLPNLGNLFIKSILNSLLQAFG